MSIPISKTLEEIRTEVFGYITQVQDDYKIKGWLPASLNLNKGIVRGVIEIWCWGLFQLYSFLITILAMAFPESAKGLWLELHCKQVGIDKKLATKTSGTMFLLRDDTAGNLPIPAGRIVKTLPDGTGNVYRFVTMEEVVIADGAGEIEVKVRAENTGAGYNVTAGQVSEIVTFIDGVDGVENRTDWLDSEGTDDETDEALYLRYLLKWKEGSGYAKYAYQGWTLGVSGVSEVKVLDQHPRGQGTVDIIIRGTAGVPTQQVIDDVTAVIEDARHQNDDVQVRGVVPSNVTIEVQLECVPGVILADIIVTAEQKLTALFDPNKEETGIIPFIIGEDLTRDRLTAAAMLVPGVKSTPWTLPAAGITVADDGLLTLQSMTITAAEASES
jgi:uncharacterized phage protein gp47/JayE